MKDKDSKKAMQMYKIYINDTPIFLTNTKTAKNRKRDDRNLVALHRHRKALFQYVDSLEKNHQFDSITIYSHDLENLKNDFFSIYKIVPAAGGAVYNNKDKVLMIYRRGFWDLPKGKIDRGETIQETAVREVAEEVGLDDVELLEQLPTTYHTYRNKKGIRCLKPGYWFKMYTETTDVVLQTEEDIEDSIWIKPKKFLKSNRKAYNSIMDILEYLVEK